MMRNLNIIATATGGAGANGIFWSLRNNGERNIRIIATDMNENAPGLYLADKKYLVPQANSGEYITKMLDIAKKEKADAIIPFSPKELLPLAKNKKKFEKIGTKILISDEKAIKLVQDRLKLFSFLKNKRIPQVKFKLVNNLKKFKETVYDFDYPKVKVCFKTRIEGGGGRGFRIIDSHLNKKDFLINYKEGIISMNLEDTLILLRDINPFPELVVMEYLPGEEYSIDLIVKDGHPLIIIPRVRVATRFGASVVGVVKKDKKVIEMVRRIAEVIPLNYNINMQLKYSTDGIPKLVEINPRVSGTICLCTVAGVNLPYLGIKMLLGEKFTIPSKIDWGKKMIRYWGEIYVNKNR